MRVDPYQKRVETRRALAGHKKQLQEREEARQRAVAVRVQQLQEVRLLREQVQQRITQWKRDRLAENHRRRRQDRHGLKEFQERYRSEGTTAREKRGMRTGPTAEQRQLQRERNKKRLEELLERIARVRAVASLSGASAPREEKIRRAFSRLLLDLKSLKKQCDRDTEEELLVKVMCVMDLVKDNEHAVGGVEHEDSRTLLSDEISNISSDEEDGSMSSSLQGSSREESARGLPLSTDDLVLSPASMVLPDSNTHETEEQEEEEEEEDRDRKEPSQRLYSQPEWSTRVPKWKAETAEVGQGEPVDGERSLEDVIQSIRTRAARYGVEGAGRGSPFAPSPASQPSSSQSVSETLLRWREKLQQREDSQSLTPKRMLKMLALEEKRKQLRLEKDLEMQRVTSVLNSSARTKLRRSWGEEEQILGKEKEELQRVLKEEFSPPRDHLRADVDDKCTMKESISTGSPPQGQGQGLPPRTLTTPRDTTMVLRDEEPGDEEEDGDSSSKLSPSSLRVTNLSFLVDRLSPRVRSSAPREPRVSESGKVFYLENMPPSLEPATDDSSEVHEEPLRVSAMELLQESFIRCRQDSSGHQSASPCARSEDSVEGQSPNCRPEVCTPTPDMGRGSVASVEVPMLEEDSGSPVPKAIPGAGTPSTPAQVLARHSHLQDVYRDFYGGTTTDVSPIYTRKQGDLSPTTSTSTSTSTTVDNPCHRTPNQLRLAKLLQQSRSLPRPFTTPVTEKEARVLLSLSRSIPHQDTHKLLYGSGSGDHSGGMSPHQVGSSERRRRRWERDMDVANSSVFAVSSHTDRPIRQSPRPTPAELLGQGPVDPDEVGGPQWELSELQRLVESVSQRASTLRSRVVLSRSHRKSKEPSPRRRGPSSSPKL